MRILVLHLSDIHFKSAKDAVLSRGDAIVDAVRNLELDIDVAVVSKFFGPQHGAEETQLRDPPLPAEAVTCRLESSC